ncbi:uncharacterized short-chain type dehydrogenase/reductase y4vI-like [Ischnura elegans]|uniref:uncharacterized short-chain type dehydrogenase/reductase y4vI-like n=1 Tax=Ischnura elegans TaxID=197161 RepID=UPI001ED8BE35|nr:uncharacterized short-chain type dehydrogenase/reductase y4vI-like [Ischnura elegans]
MEPLRGKVAIVTGAASGIGLSIATTFLQNGASVALLDHNEEKLLASAKRLQEEHGKIKVACFTCDVTNKDQFQGAVKRAVERFSRLDIFVNNAGIPESTPRWEYIIEVNLLGVMRGVEEAVKHMSRESGGEGGVIVNMASLLGLMPHAKSTAYAASKHGVIGFTRSLGREEVLETQGIRYMAICPGFTESELTKAAPAEVVNALAQALDITPDMQKPESVAACVLEVVKSASTGSVWVVENDLPGYEIAFPYYKSMRKTRRRSCGNWPIMELEGKIALVTGGAGGIGESISRALLENGASVVMFDMNSARGEELRRQMEEKHGKGRAHFVAGDVTKKEDLERAFKETLEKFSYLDILLNNAGIGDENRWEEMIHINWVAVVRGTTEALKIMSKKAGGRGGVVVSISSVAGLIAFTAGPVYTGTKSAVNAFTRCHGSSEEYESTGVRFMAVCPGVTDTELFRGPSGKDLRNILKMVEEQGGPKHIPQTPEFVANEVIGIIKNAKSGSVWVVQRSEAAYQVNMRHHRDLELVAE